MFTRFRFGLDKMRWGVKVVGPGAALRGCFRLLVLMLTRPQRSEVRLRSGPLLEFDAASQRPSALIAFGDVIDPEFAFVRAVARPDWVVVDVGAAIGQFAIIAATLPAAVVHAYEPDGLNVATLRRNIERNRVAHVVEVHQTALSNVDAEAAFTSNKHRYVSGLSSERRPGDPIVSVRTLTGEMDRLGIARVSLLKINVAGFEAPVLAGARDLIAAGRVDILILLLGLDSLASYNDMAERLYRFFYYHPVEAKLYEVTAFDASSVLDHRPWPARHIIAIHASMVESYVGGRIGLALCETAAPRTSPVERAPAHTATLRTDWARHAAVPSAQYETDALRPRKA